MNDRFLNNKRQIPNMKSQHKVYDEDKLPTENKENNKVKSNSDDEKTPVMSEIDKLSDSSHKTQLIKKRKTEEKNKENQSNSTPELSENENYEKKNNNMKNYIDIVTYNKDNKEEKEEKVNKTQEEGEVKKEPSSNTQFMYLEISKYDIKNEISKINDIETSIINDNSLLEHEKKSKLVDILLFKIIKSNGSIKKSSVKTLIDKSEYYTEEILINQVLEVLNLPIDLKERHDIFRLLEKLFLKLNIKIKPFTKKIIHQIGPLLMDQFYYTRIEAKDLITYLTKAVGIPNILLSIKSNIFENDEHSRTLLSKILAVVSSSFGINSILPFINMLITTNTVMTKLSALKIIQQIGLFLGNSVLPFLNLLVDICYVCLKEDNSKIKIFSSLALSSLAEASFPFGCDSFKQVINELSVGLDKTKSKVFSSYLKAMSNIISLMEDSTASTYIMNILPVIRKEFESNDDELKKAILISLKKYFQNNCLSGKYIKDEIQTEFIYFFIDRRTANDKQTYKLCVDATIELSKKVGGGEIIKHIMDRLQDENELLRKMTVDIIYYITKKLDVDDLEVKQEEGLIDKLLLNFQYYDSDDKSNNIINCISYTLKAYKYKANKYIQQVFDIIQWRFNNKSARIRMYSMDLISQISEIIHDCGYENLLIKIGRVLNEYLGEEYPEVLGSVIKAIKSVGLSIGFNKFDPPIREFLPKISPILKNNHIKVQENILKLIGIIAKDNSDCASAKEWMRISFDLIELLKSEKKSIRKNAIETFGYIAKAIGPQDVLLSLLNNFKIQERQVRVSSTIAIAVISETCGPFTVIPLLMNEYRFNELNIQNGVLKSFSYIFEYIGEMSRDYIYSIVSLLEHALIEKDIVHRQLACAGIKHLSIGVYGHGCEDCLIHLLNYVWPNVLETTPHFIMSFLEAIEGLRVGLGVSYILPYVMIGLFHPARRVREAYWRIYNILYIGNPEGVSMYCSRFIPSKYYVNNIRNDGNVKYEENELEIFV